MGINKIINKLLKSYVLFVDYYNKNYKKRGIILIFMFKNKNFHKKIKNKYKLFKIKIKINFNNYKQTTDLIFKIIIYCFTMITISFFLIIIGFMIYKSIYFFQNYNNGFFGFLFGKIWNPNNGDFGILRIIISTFIVLLFSLMLAIPLTIFSSLFICEYLTYNWKKRVINIVQLLAAIPSVVFGLFSLSILSPLFLYIGAVSTSHLLITSITLSFMGLPIMILLSINAIESVPNSYRFNSLALGLSKINTTYKIVFKVASIKIIAAIMLGVARIIGETMAVMMISGNISDSLTLNNGFLKFVFSSVSTLSSTIGLEILENSGVLHESALYAIGLVLFVIIIIINIFVLWAQLFTKNNLKIYFRRKKILIKKYNSSKIINNIFYAKIAKNKKIKKISDIVGLFFLVFSTIIVVSFTLLIIISIIWKGILNINFYDIISVSTYNDGSGIFSAFLVTLLLIFLTIILAFPFSIITAIYLNEYLKSNNLFAKIIRFFFDLLISTPSIIYGIFGLTFFISILKIPLSILSTSFTLALLIIPNMIRNIEDALSNIPNSLRQASFALGANKITTIVRIVIPNILSGIVTTIVLSIGRIIGESAPVYLTLGTSIRFPSFGLLSPGSNITTAILMLLKEGSTFRTTQIIHELGLVIIILILFINLLTKFFLTKISFNFANIAIYKKNKKNL